MYQQVVASISNYISLDPSELEYFCDLLKPLVVKRKEYLLEEGDVCQQAYFINQGALRIFNSIDGVEITGQFFFENEWYTDYASFLPATPSLLYIQALEKTELLVLSKPDLQLLFSHIPKFERFGRLIAENAFLGLLQRTEMYANQSPEQRYLSLLQVRPNIFQRVPQHYIASYLGITPPSLSRIRKRLLDKA